MRCSINVNPFKRNKQTMGERETTEIFTVKYHMKAVFLWQTSTHKIIQEEATANYVKSHHNSARKRKKNK